MKSCRRRIAFLTLTVGLLCCIYVYSCLMNGHNRWTRANLKYHLENRRHFGLLPDNENEDLAWLTGDEYIHLGNETMPSEACDVEERWVKHFSSIVEKMPPEWDQCRLRVAGLCPWWAVVQREPKLVHLSDYRSIPRNHRLYKTRCMEDEWGSINPAVCFDLSDRVNRIRRGGGGLLYVGTIRDGVERLVSDYSYRGPGSVLSRVEAEQASTWWEWRQSSEPRPGLPGLRDDDEDSTDFDIRTIVDGAVTVKRVGSNSTHKIRGQRVPKGGYTPNLMTILLSGTCPNTTSLKLLYEYSHKLMYNRPYLCPECSFDYIDPHWQRKKLSRHLKIAKRAIVSFDLLIPQVNLSDTLYLFELARLHGDDFDGGTSEPVERNVGNADSKAAPPDSFREVMQKDNWADAILYDFAQRVFACKQLVYRELYQLELLYCKANSSSSSDEGAA